MPLVNLSYMLPYQDTLPLFNYEAERVGHVVVNIVPCDAGGAEMDYDVDNPIELVSSASYLYYSNITMTF